MSMTVQFRISLDGEDETFIVEPLAATDEWHVYLGDEGGHLGTLDSDGRVVNVDQHGDWRAKEALLKRVHQERMRCMPGVLAEIAKLK